MDFLVHVSGILGNRGVTIEAQYGEVHGSSDVDKTDEDLTYQVWIFLFIFLTYQEAEVSQSRPNMERYKVHPSKIK